MNIVGITTRFTFKVIMTSNQTHRWLNPFTGRIKRKHSKLSKSSGKIKIEENTHTVKTPEKASSKANSPNHKTNMQKLRKKRKGSNTINGRQTMKGWLQQQDTDQYFVTFIRSICLQKTLVDS